MGQGPLQGVRVVEIASLAPAPFGCMILSDLGASVIQVDRVGARSQHGPGRYRSAADGGRSA